MRKIINKFYRNGENPKANFLTHNFQKQNKENYPNCKAKEFFISPDNRIKNDLIDTYKIMTSMLF